MTTPSRRRRYDRQASIARIPAGTNPDARQVLLTNLPCSPVYEMDKEARERADMGTVTAARRVYCDPPAINIEKRMRFILAGKDYVIHRVAGHPADAPQFLELFLEDETP